MKETALSDGSIHVQIHIYIHTSNQTTYRHSQRAAPETEEGS